VHILTALAGRLRKRDSPYEAVLWALVALAEAKGTVTDTSLLESEPDTDPDDLTALDAAWEETPVVFGPEAAGNRKDDLVARIRAAKRPAVRPQ
jgi:nitrate reductase delta subunit